MSNSRAPLTGLRVIDRHRRLVQLRAVTARDLVQLGLAPAALRAVVPGSKNLQLHLLMHRSLLSFFPPRLSLVSFVLALLFALLFAWLSVGGAAGGLPGCR